MRTRFVLFALVFGLPSLAFAQVDAQVAAWSRQLATGKDPQARSRAAQRLGASEDPEAVRSLCTALEDPSEAVRVEAAHALEKLQEVSGLDCLQAREAEADEVAKAAIAEAIRTLQDFKARAPSRYVAMEVKDRQGVLSPELVRFTEQRIARGLVQGGAQLAPKGETKAAARGVLQKRGIPGFLLMVEVQPAEDDGLRLTVVGLRYPDRSLLGQVEVRASGAEHAELLKALIPRIIEDAAETFEWSS